MTGRAFSPGRQVPEVALIGQRRHCSGGFSSWQKNVIENHSHKNSILKIIFAMVYCYTCPILFLVIVINISLSLERCQMYMCIRRKTDLYYLWFCASRGSLEPCAQGRTTVYCCLVVPLCMGNLWTWLQGRYWNGTNI